MLIAMTVVAVLCTAIGAFIRRFPVEAQPRLTLYWCILLALFAACFALNARRRYVAEKKAGPALFQLTPHSYLFPKSPRVARIFIGSFLLALGPMCGFIVSFDIADGPLEWLHVLNVQSISGLIGAGIGITYLWWHRKVRLTERGLIVRHKFVPWKYLRKYYWDACYRNVIVLQFQEPQSVVANVPAEDRAAVETLLAQKMKSWLG
jgi:hypothetical protein